MYVNHGPDSILMISNKAEQPVLAALLLLRCVTQVVLRFLAFEFGEDP
jgi:hypothetical protein